MRRLGLLLVPLLASGCFLDRSSVAGDGAPDAQGPQLPDAGPPPDAGRQVDAGSPVDAGEREDTGTPTLDGGPSCTVEDDGCQGQNAVRCVDGELMAEACTQACWLDPVGGPRCVTCIPGTGRCEEGGAVAEVCMDDASGWGARTDCPRGCDPNTVACRPETPCDDTVDAVMAPTSAGPPQRFNLCASDVNRRYDSSTHPSNCDGHDGNDMTPTVNDILVRLEIARAGTYRIRVEDDDNTAAIAPLVYIRSACGDEGNQLICWDAIDTSEFRELDFTVDLPAGDYFVIIDGYEYDRPGTINDPTCGQVRVRIDQVGS